MITAPSCVLSPNHVTMAFASITRAGLGHRLCFYGRAKRLRSANKPTSSRHLGRALRPGSQMNLRVIAFTLKKEGRALILMLEGVLIIYLRAINRMSAERLGDFNPATMSTFILSYGIEHAADTWQGLNDVCALSQGCRAPFNFLACSGCGEAFDQGTHKAYHVHEVTNELMDFHRNCRRNYFIGLLETDPLLHKPLQKCDNCFISKVTCDGASPCGA